MTRRHTARVLVLVLALLAACSSGDGGDDSDGGAGPSTSTSTAPAADGTTATTAPSGNSTTAPPAEIADSPPKLRAVKVAEFDQPIAMVTSPTGLAYVAEKGGRIRELGDADEGSRRVLLDISGDVSTGGEQGLLGLAIAPDGRHAYVNYTDTKGDTRVVEYALRGDGALDTGSRRELLMVDQPASNHNGGHLAFGPDGYLFIALGDGGGGGDPDENAQNLGTLLGKILRIDPDPDGAGVYAIPPGNPFAGRSGAKPEIWAYGLRNPWRFSFDRATGELWIGDVGQNRIEEIDRSPAGSKGGENYGWDRLEGTRRFEGSPPDDHVLPVYEYDRGGNSNTCSVTGGYVYRGSAVPDLRGWYVFGDYCQGDLRGVRADVERASGDDAFSFGAKVESVVSFAEDANGELFALSLDGGVYKLTERGS